MNIRLDISAARHAVNVFRGLDGDLVSDVIQEGVFQSARVGAKSIKETTKFKDRRPGRGLRSKIRASHGKPRFRPSAIIRVGGKGARQGNILEYGSKTIKSSVGFAKNALRQSLPEMSRVFSVGIEDRFVKVLRNLYFSTVSGGGVKISRRTLGALSRNRID